MAISLSLFVFLLLFQGSALAHPPKPPSPVHYNVSVSLNRKHSPFNFSAVPPNSTGDGEELKLSATKKGICSDCLRHQQCYEHFPYPQVNCTLVNGATCKTFPSETGKRKKVSVEIKVGETRKGVSKDSLFHAFVPRGFSICEFSRTIQPKATANKQKAYVSMAFCFENKVNGNLSLTVITPATFSNSLIIYTPYELAFRLRVNYS